MMLCVASAGKVTAYAATAFTLFWFHSVEKTRWEEHWAVTSAGLVATESLVEGSGAGMEPPPDAVLRGDAYVYRPHLPPLPELVLAASGGTGDGWHFCPESGTCTVLGATAEAPIRIAPCKGPPPD